MAKTITYSVGDVILIPVLSGKYALAQIVEKKIDGQECLLFLYDKVYNSLQEYNENDLLQKKPFGFFNVMDHKITGKPLAKVKEVTWIVIDHKPVAHMDFGLPTYKVVWAGENLIHDYNKKLSKVVSSLSQYPQIPHFSTQTPPAVIDAIEHFLSEKKLMDMDDEDSNYDLLSSIGTKVIFGEKANKY